MGKAWLLWSGELIRISSSVFGFLLSAVLLGGCEAGIDYIKSSRSTAFNEQWKKHVEKIHNIEIDNPFLSYDGRYMAFDFRQLLVKKEESGTTTNLVGIYDFDTGGYSLVTPFGEAIGFHSPSFNKAADKLLMVSHCFDAKTCDENIRGNQIVMYDLKSKELNWLTSYFTDGKYRKGSYSDQSTISYLGRTIIRGYPIFDLTETGVYSVVGNGRTSSNYFHQRFNGDFSLVRHTPSIKVGGDWNEKLLVNHEDQFGHFVNGGRLSISRSNEILIYAGKIYGDERSEFQKETINAFFYDVKSDRLSIAFDENNSPVNASTMDPYFRTWTTLHVTDRSGTRIAFQGRSGHTIFIREGNSNRQLLTSDELGLTHLGELHMSGDGKWIVVFPSEAGPKNNDLKYFWRINVETRERAKIALRDPILTLVKNIFPGSNE